jgi:deoxyadenosine/deoxycytidine kinase
MNCAGVICLEGLIGSGKSTLGNILQENISNAKYYAEYVNIPLIKYYLEDMKNNAYSFQIIMLHQRFNTYHLALQHVMQGGLAIIDRSFCGDYAFALMQKQKAYINDNQWQIYLDIVKEQQNILEKSYPNFIIPQAILYLNCDIETCLHRIALRNRDSENSYTVEYLQDLQNSYTETLKLSKCPIYKIDNNNTLDDNKLSEIIFLIANQIFSKTNDLLESR